VSAAGSTPDPKIVLLLASDLDDPPWQPPGRTERGIDELAESIKQQGVIEPLIVRETPIGHEIVCGCRRNAAAKSAALTHVPCIIRELSDELGVTSIVVSHDLASIFSIADKIVMLYRGKVKLMGTPQEFRASADPIVRQFIEGRARGPME
jgi:ABC-type thiamine transport system ATPase subunit